MIILKILRFFLRPFHSLKYKWINYYYGKQVRCIDLIVNEDDHREYLIKNGIIKRVETVKVSSKLKISKNN